MVTKSGAIRGGGKQTLAAALGIGATVKARAAQLIGDALNSGHPLIGGPEMTTGDSSPMVAGTGFPIPNGTPLYLPYSSVWTELYELDEMYVFVAPGDVLYVLWELG